MPLRFDSVSEGQITKILAWILKELDNIDDAFGTQKDGKTFALASRGFFDKKTNNEIGKYVYTIFSNEKEQRNEILDLDVILNNDSPVTLSFERKLPQSSDSNEYYDIVTEEGTHLIAETVNRYVVPGEIEGSKQSVFVSAFPFQLTIFDSSEERNSFFGFKKPVRAGTSDIIIHGFGPTFAAPGNMLKEDSDEAPWSLLFGDIISLREITLSFGDISRDAFLLTLRSALGDLPTLVGKDYFDTNGIGVGKVVAMNAYIKANFVKDKYPK